MPPKFYFTQDYELNPKNSFKKGAKWPFSIKLHQCRVLIGQKILSKKVAQPTIKKKSKGGV